MKTIIKVTQEDIDKGIRRIATCCPIARAIKRQLGCEYVNVGLGTIIYADKEMAYSDDSDIEKFLLNFDVFIRPVEPFEFELDI